MVTLIVDIALNPLVDFYRFHSLKLILKKTTASPTAFAAVLRIQPAVGHHAGAFPHAVEVQGEGPPEGVRRGLAMQQHAVCCLRPATRASRAQTQQSSPPPKKSPPRAGLLRWASPTPSPAWAAWSAPTPPSWWVALGWGARARQPPLRRQPAGVGQSVLPVQWLPRQGTRPAGRAMRARGRTS
jgi:hypothetical protein